MYEQARTHKHVHRIFIVIVLYSPCNYRHYYFMLAIKYVIPRKACP